MADVEEEVDRISFLPSEIKLSILSRLMIKDAVRTSALARSWRHLWTHLPCLRLDSARDRLGNTPSSWIQCVHRIISSLLGPLLVFQLHFLNDTTIIHLPWFHSLRVLKLISCLVALPTGFQGFHRLETLDLDDVEISNDDLNLLLHTSNNLTSLIITYCRASGIPLSVNLSVPLLRHLELGIADFVENASVDSSPCLEHAAIKLSPAFYSSQNSAKMMLRLVTNVAMVSSLILDFDVFKCFSLVTLPFNFTFPRLKFLRFKLNVGTMDRRVYDSLFWLLRSMPFLEELNVELDMDDDYDEADRVPILMRELLVKKHDGFACLERTVTSVTINAGWLDVPSSIVWMQFFLLNAKRLKLLKIYYVKGCDLIIEELQKEEVISSDAKVVFFNHFTDQITNLCIND